jgi:hypothetical protein
MWSIPLPELYSSLHSFVGQTLPDGCESRVANGLWVMYGIFLGRSVQLNNIAHKMPSRAKKLSTVKRFSHFLDNPAVRPRAWYDPFACWIIGSATARGQVHLITDSTRIAFGFRLVMVSLAYRRRSLPLVWMWERGTRGHSTGRSQVTLLTAVQGWLPPQVRVSVVGDCEFGRCSLIDYLRQMDWDYALRQFGSQTVWWQGNGRWQHVDSLLSCFGCRWLGWVVLTHTNEQLTHLVAYWRKSEPQAWWLATNRLSARPCVCTGVACGLRRCLAI